MSLIKKSLKASNETTPYFRDEAHKLYTIALTKLHKRWKPFSKQLPVLKKIFMEKVPLTFLQCGRKWSKTEIAIYISYYHCWETPNPAVYYFAPFYKQAKEILWAPKRIQNFLPEVHVSKPNESELRISVLGNGFIKLDGADNFEAGRGITPSLVIYDEYKDFKKGFHIAMEPNFAARKAQLVVLGTPPDHETEYFELAKEAKSYGAHFIRPTSDNPYVDRDWLQKRKEILLARGEESTWIREYEGRYVAGGPDAIFPMFSKALVKPHKEIMAILRKDLPKLHWHCIADPGTVTCFGMLFGAYNPYTKQVFWLDEIYEKNQASTSVDQIWPRADKIRHDLLPFMEGWDGRWTLTADEAAAWFRNEVMDRFNVYFQPTMKAQNKKGDGLSLIKDQMRLVTKVENPEKDKPENIVTISDRCEKLIWEVENYVRDGKGNIPKENDHLIDDWRYGNAAEYYQLNTEKEEKKPDTIPRRGYSLEEDLPELLGDIGIGIEADLFEDY